jgi:hypothetical protein
VTALAEWERLDQLSRQLGGEPREELRVVATGVGRGRRHCTRCGSLETECECHQSEPRDFKRMMGDGAGSCLGGARVPEPACGIRWGHLSHRHCRCGRPMAADLDPELDRCARCVAKLVLEAEAWSPRA